MLGAIFDKWWSQSELKSYFVEKTHLIKQDIDIINVK